MSNLLIFYCNDLIKTNQYKVKNAKIINHFSIIIEESRKAIKYFFISTLRQFINL